MTIEAFAPAKINLCLHVTGQRKDGYHLLDSLVVFARLGDTLRLTAGPELSMTVTGTFADGVPADARNLAWRAAEMAGWTGHISLEKRIPHGAGLGGGSADAAAVLRALDLAAQGRELGADVPVCRWPGPQRMRGTGERLQRVDTPVLHLVLAHPGASVRTADVFAGLANKANTGLDWPPTASLADWLGRQRNDLDTAACAVAPVIGDVLAALRDTGAQLARMSGSGACCFGLYPDEETAEAAAARLSAANSDWWIASTRTLAAAEADTFG